MTVCIVAMCKGAIFGAADRMKTAGDVQFEPPAPKIFQLTASIAVMTAGDAAFNSEILRELYKTVIERIQNDPENWWTIKDVAELYAKNHNLLKLKRAENKILTPLGLDKNSFIEKQGTMSEGFITRITQEMVNFDIPYVSAIIAGADPTGHHIYVINGDEISCWDPVGFASIGSGSRHADSQFMLAGHSWNAPLPETLLLTYTAKKRSEIAPGVGSSTDMFLIEGLNSFVSVGQDALDKLENMYKKAVKREIKNTQIANEEIRVYVERLSQTATSQGQAQATQIDGGATPINESDISNNAATG